MDASEDEIVIVKVENEKVTKRTSDGASSKTQKKRKLETDGKTDVILLSSSSSSGNNDSSENEDGNKSKRKGKTKANSSEEMARDGPVVIDDVVECRRSQTVTYIRNDLEIVEQEMLDHALALSLMQEEMDGYTKRKAQGTRSSEELPPADNILRNLGKSPAVQTSSSSVSTEQTNNNRNQQLGSQEQSPSTSVSSSHSPSTELTDKDVEFPKYWQPMGVTASNSKSYELYMVLPGTEEFQAIAQYFHRKPLIIYSVKRIQNLHFLKRYNLEKKLILDSCGNGYNLNEQRLFHTSAANPDDICEQGLDLRLSNGGSFGNGIYFSDDILKCHGYWRHSFQPALMFQCRVILGDIKEYPPNVRDVHLRREPEKAARTPGKQRYYDSVKGNITGRNEYVVYNAYRILPEYMIEYTYTSTQQKGVHKRRGHTVPALPAYVQPPQAMAPPTIVPTAPTQDPRYIQILNMMQNKNKRTHKS